MAIMNVLAELHQEHDLKVCIIEKVYLSITCQSEVTAKLTAVTFGSHSAVKPEV